MSAPVPTLTAAGWAQETFKKADAIIGHFFVTQKSQSNFYLDNISSFPFLVHEHGNNPPALARAVESNVSALLNRYFGGSSEKADVSVTATITDLSPTDSTRYNLKLNASVTINGVHYSLGKIINVADGVTKKIFDINNG